MVRFGSYSKPFSTSYADTLSNFKSRSISRCVNCFSILIILSNINYLLLIGSIIIVCSVHCIQAIKSIDYINRSESDISEYVKYKLMSLLIYIIAPLCKFFSLSIQKQQFFIFKHFQNIQTLMSAQIDGK